MESGRCTQTKQQCLPARIAQKQSIKRVLVTGANGFIGQALCRALIVNGFKVIGVLRRFEAAEFLPPGTMQATYTPDGTVSPQAMEGVDAVVHLAGRAHVLRETGPSPSREFRQANVILSSRVAEAASTAGVRHFVFVSTAKIYGERSTTSFNEASSPSPCDPYASSKLEAEECLRAISAANGLSLTILRPPLVYGPGTKANFLSLLRLVRLPLPLPLGGINNRRSMIFLDNFVDCMLTCLSHQDAGNKTFCISDGEDLSTSELVYRLGAAMGKSPRLVRLPSEGCRRILAALGLRGHYDRLWGSFQVDSAKITDTLGWRAPYSVDHGLAATVHWFLNQM